MGSLDAYILAQREWISRCQDAQALLDKMAEWRADVRAGERDGNSLMRMRAGDLIELAEDRIVVIKAEKLRSGRASVPAVRTAPTAGAGGEHGVRQSRVESPDSDRRDRDEAVRRADERRAGAEGEHFERKSQQQRRIADEQELARQAAAAQAAAARIAMAKAVQIEARTALLREQAALARRSAVATQSGTPGRVATVVGAKRLTLDGRAPERAAAGSQAKTRLNTTGLSEQTAKAGRSASLSDGAEDKEISPLGRLFLDLPRESPAPDRPRSGRVRSAPEPLPPAELPVSESENLPPFCGADLTAYRQQFALTQRALAAVLGVEQGTVSKGEGRPRAVLRPTLRRAFNRIIDTGPEAARRTITDRSSWNYSRMILESLRNIPWNQAGYSVLHGTHTTVESWN